MKKEQVQRRPRTRSMSDAPDEAPETPKVDPAAEAGNFPNLGVPGASSGASDIDLVLGRR
jgi:hypothetical protein